MKIYLKLKNHMNASMPHSSLEVIKIAVTCFLIFWGHPKDFDCPKNPKTAKISLVEKIRKAYKLNMKPSVDGGCPPCCACCGVIIQLAKELGIDENE